MYSNSVYGFLFMKGRTMSKKLISLMLAVLMVVTLLPATVIADEAADDSQETVTEAAAEDEDSVTTGSDDVQEGENTAEDNEESPQIDDADDQDAETDDPENKEDGSEEDGEVPEDGENAEDAEAGETPAADAEKEADPDSELKDGQEPSKAEAEGVLETTEDPEKAEEKAEEPMLLEETESKVNFSNGYYKFTTALSTAYVLDVKGMKSDDGTNVQLYKTRYVESQIFYMKKVKNKDGSEYYNISPYYAKGSGLEVADGKKKSGTNVQLKKLTAYNKQKWYFTKGKTSGTYVIHSALSNSKLDLVLDVRGGNAKNGANVQVLKNFGEPRQSWKVTKLTVKDFKNGTYNIHPAKNGAKTIAVSNALTTDNTNVGIGSNADVNYKKFIINSVGSGFYKIKGVASRKVLDISAGSTEPGSNVAIYSFNGSPAQIWKIVPTGRKNQAGEPMYHVRAKNGLYLSFYKTNVRTSNDPADITTMWTFEKTKAQPGSNIKSGIYNIVCKANENEVFDINRASLDPGGNTQIFTRNNSNAQKFRIVKAEDGKVYIKSINSGLYLNAAGGNIANGTNIQQFTNDKTDAVKWTLVDTGDNDGSVYIRSGSSKFGMDLASGNTGDGTNVQLYKGNGTKAQKFFLVKTQTTTGWQIFEGKRRYVKDTKGNYYKNTKTPDGRKVGADGTPNPWIVKNGYYRYELLNGTLANDVRPYLNTLFANKTMTNVHGGTYTCPNCPYYATVDRVKNRVTIYTKYPGTNNWNLPVCCFMCSTGTAGTPTDAGLWTTGYKSGWWQSLMGPSYGQFATYIQGGEFFHSVACGHMNRENLYYGNYNVLGANASHGCVRLNVRNAYWMHTFVPLGLKVYISDDLACPLQHCPQPRIRPGWNIDPTDPYYTGNYGYVDTNKYYGEGHYYF